MRKIAEGKFNKIFETISISLIFFGEIFIHVPRWGMGHGAWGMGQRAGGNENIDNPDNPDNPDNLDNPTTICSSANQLILLNLLCTKNPGLVWVTSRNSSSSFSMAHNTSV